MKRIVFLDRAGLPTRFDVRAPKLEHQWIEYTNTSAEQLIERCTDADVVISNKVKINAQLLKACPSIKHIAVAATGYNVIDVQACREHGVSVSNIPSYASTTVAEHVITSALCLRRELNSYRNQVINGDWQTSSSFCLFGKAINDINNTTLGVIGLGELGLATAAKAHALGMNIIYSSPSEKHCDFAKRVELNYLLAHSDIVSVHCSLTPATENLISKAELSMMKPSAILINTARGGVVNEADAVAAINKQTIAALSFDVLVQEPPQADSPLLKIANKSNVIITPHIAWASEQSMQALSDILSSNVEAFLLGSPVNLVT